MRRCGKCLKVPRRDDNLEFHQVTVESGAGLCTFTAYVCRECLGKPDPLHVPGNAPVPICGICRKAQRDEQWGQCMRLLAEDLDGTDVAPGCYQSCDDCVQRFKGHIHDRLLAAGYRVPPLANFGGDWLL